MNKKKLHKFFDNKEEFAPNERLWLFCMLMLVAGFFGGFTFSLRGRVFVNAQTGNLVLLSLGFATWDTALIKNALATFLAYFCGIITAELISKKINKTSFLIWERILLIFSIIVTICLGFIPEAAPYEFTNFPIAFTAAMQFNTFEKAQGMGMATPFCTNHVKQASANFVRFLRTRDDNKLRISLSHLSMILSFIIGATLSIFLGRFLFGKAIWLSTIFLIITFYFFSKSIKEYKKKL